MGIENTVENITTDQSIDECDKTKYINDKEVVTKDNSPVALNITPAQPMKTLNKMRNVKLKVGDVEKTFETIERQIVSGNRKRIIVKCKLCAKDVRKDKRYDHVKSSH